MKISATRHFLQIAFSEAALHSGFRTFTTHGAEVVDRGVTDGTLLVHRLGARPHYCTALGFSFQRYSIGRADQSCAACPSTDGHCS